MSSRLSLLLVDDDAVDRRAVRRALDAARLPLDVIEADDAPEALALLTARRFDVALLDFRLPKADGFEVIAQARAAGVTTPIVVLTGQGDEETAVALMRAGAADYLSKTSLTSDRLARSVDHAIRVDRAERAARDAEHALASRAEQLRSLAEAAVRINAELSIEAVLGVLTAQARRIVGAHQAVASIRRDANSGAKATSVSEEYVAAVARGAGVGAGQDAPSPYARVWLENRSMLLTRAEGESLPPRPDGGASPSPWLPFGGWLAAPLVGRDGRNLGVLELTEKYVGEFGEQDEAIVVQLAQMASTVIENATLLFDAQAARAEAQRNEHRFRALSDAIPQQVWTSTSDGTLDYVNDRVVQYTGVPSSEIIALSWMSLVHPDDAPGVEDAWARALQHGEPFVCEYRLRSAMGRYRWFLSRAVPMREEGGDASKWFGTNTDVDDQKRAEQERDALLEQEQVARRSLEVARSALEEANRAKDEFLAVVSHELRTPLNAMLGWTRLLRVGAVPPDRQQKALDTVERNARAQAQLVEDLLDITRVISGKLRLNVAEVDVAHVIAAAVDTVRPAADAKGVRVNVVIDPATGPISGDADRIQQVIWNLLSNGVKFTPKDGSVQVRLAPRDTDVEITVEDTGCGIAPAFLPYVFDRFRQAEGGTTRSQGGLGLGLAIVRHLVELHGGTIRAESAGEGAGAVFTVCLPMSPVVTTPPKSDVPPRSSARPLPSVPGLSGLRVLVVDDEADARELLRTVFEQNGINVETATNAAEAFAALVRARPDVLVSDIGMAVEDGYSFIRKVRALSPLKGGATPAVALTSYARSEDRSKALRAGFTMHMAKPVDPAELLIVVANVAGRLAHHVLV